MVELLGIFGFLVVLLRAAILCFQTIAIGGILFLTIVARTTEQRSEELLRSCWKLIRMSALALAISQLLFVIANSLVLTYSTDIPISAVFSTNYVWAGLLAVIAGVALALWPKSLRTSVNPLAMLPAACILAASVMTSHSASRLEGRVYLVSLTTLHYLATAAWIGGLPYLLLSAKRTPDSQQRNQILRRFSRLAQISVAVLLLAGLGMSLVFVGSWNAMYGTAYGVMLGAKIAMFVVLLILGAANYYIVRGIDDRYRNRRKKSVAFW